MKVQALTKVTTTHVESAAEKASTRVTKTSSKMTAATSKTGSTAASKSLATVFPKETSGISANFVERKVAQAQPVRFTLPETVSTTQLPELLKKDTEGSAFGLRRIKAVKVSPVEAIEAKGGEVVTTTLKNGLTEVENRIANSGDWIVTNPGGEKYIVSADVFAETYLPLGEGRFTPKGGTREFVRIEQDLDLVVDQWGGDVQKLKKGAFLKVDNPADMYGIGEEEFYQTHKIIE